MRRTISLPDRPILNGMLPRDARLRLQTAAQIGKPGSIARRRAIQKAYQYIDDTYPEYLRKDTNDGQ